MEAGFSFCAALVRRASAWCARHDALVIRSLLVCVLTVLAEQAVGAAADPWSMAASQFCTLFTGVVGRGLVVVAVVYVGLTYAIGENNSKSAMAALVFGAGMVLLAPQLLVFFFGGTAITC